MSYAYKQLPSTKVASNLRGYIVTGENTELMDMRLADIQEIPALNHSIRTMAKSSGGAAEMQEWIPCFINMVRACGDVKDSGFVP